jgi:hypothetical protein
MTGTTITPYLNFGGRCEEALEFYRDALGAEVEMLMRFDESPEPPPPGMLPAGFEVESRCGAVAQSHRPCSVSTPRSSNWTGGFPASSFRYKAFLINEFTLSLTKQCVARSFGVGTIPAPGAGRRPSIVSYPDPAP